MKPDLNVFQIGARRNYATSQIFHSYGILSSLLTDIYLKPWESKVLREVGRFCDSASIRGLIGRTNTSLPANFVHQSRFFSLFQSISRKQINSVSDELRFRVHYSNGVEKRLRRFVSPQSVLFAVNREAPNLGRSVLDSGGEFVVEQTIPPLEDEISELHRIGNLISERGVKIQSPSLDQVRGLDWFFARERRELSDASRIVCVSSHVKERLENCGVCPEKIRVVPSGLILPSSPVGRRKPGRLRVLFVGQFGTRKGANVFLELARRLRGDAHFRVVGRNLMTVEAEASSHEIKFIGPVARSALREHWDWADVLLFPSLNEGAAMVTFEALAHGVPVLCTYQSGSVVVHGENGFLFHPWEVDEMECCLSTLSKDFDALETMKGLCLKHREKISVSSYGERLFDAIRDFIDVQ